MMCKSRLVVLFAVSSFLAAGLAACSGSAGGGASGPSAGVAVDPYLVGAVLQELTPAGVLVQESSASDATGAFRFPAPLKLGNRVVLSVKGLHNGTPYGVALARVVEKQDPLVISPLTTLLASGAHDAASVVALVNGAISGAALAAADVTADPMARMLDGEVTDADRQLLAANISVGAALAVLHENAASSALAGLVQAIAPRVYAALSGSGSAAATASAATAVADYIASVSSTPAEASAAAARITDELLAALIAAAADGGCATIEDSGGTLSAGTTVATVAAHLAKGRAALTQGLSTHATDDLLRAANEFSAALILADSDASATTADKDQARFMGALARLVALAQPYSDATDDGLDDLGALLDAYGLGGTNADRKNLDTLAFLDCQDEYETIPGGQPVLVGQECSLKQLPETAPRTKEVQAFVAGNLAAALRTVAGLLDQVSASFTTTLEVGGQTLEIDRTDALFLEAAAQAMVAGAELQYAYDLDVSPHDLQAKLGEESGEGEGGAAAGLREALRSLRSSARPTLAAAGDGDSYGPADFLAEYPDFLKLVNASSLASVKTDAQAAVATGLKALDSLAAETDDQSDDLLAVSGETCTYDPEQQKTVCVPIDPAAEIAKMRGELQQVQAALSATGEYTLDMGTADPSDDVVLNTSKLFAGVNLRDMLPSFDAGASGSEMGLFPDPTFGGVLVKLPFDLNTDQDGDKAPDLFVDYSYFFPAYLASSTWYGYGNQPGMFSGTWTFPSTGNAFAFDGYASGEQGGTEIQFSGTYALYKNVLTLTLSTATSGVKTVRVTADELAHDEFWGPIEYLNASGGTVVTGTGPFWRE